MYAERLKMVLYEHEVLTPRTQSSDLSFRIRIYSYHNPVQPPLLTLPVLKCNENVRQQCDEHAILEWKVPE